MPRRWKYPLLGLWLAMGGPIGYFVMRSLFAGQIPSPEWIAVELRERADAYAYLTFATSAVFVWLGRMLGAIEDRVRADSLTDPLTGLPNRRYATERAHAVLARRKLVALLLIDLDGLKQINATQGHEGGDRALCAVAATLKRVCRGDDVFARYGGDEFVVVLPQMRASEALQVAERICATMRRVSQDNGLGPLSVSIGVTDTELARSNTVSALVEAADAPLAVAKREGKNRAKIGPSGPEVR